MKKNIIKKTALVFAIIFIVSSIVFINKFNVRAVTRTSMTILEIEPGDSFTLTKNGTKSGTETVSNTNPNMSIYITHMTMAEYVSNIDQVNGRFDVVYIGNNTSSGVTYTNPFSSMPTYLPYGKEVYNGLKDSKNNYIVGMSNNTAWLGKGGNGKTNSGASTGSKTYVEYFSENDITNKRAKEIIDNIQSGQLVYIDKNIFNYTGTKLYSNFNGLKNTNLISFDPSSKVNQPDVSIGGIANNFMASTSKRAPVLSIANTAQSTNRNMNFQYNISSDADEQGITANLYLDLNGDGLFKDKELVKSVSGINTVNKSFNGELNYTLDDQFIGDLTWKLEVVTATKVKSYKTGRVKYDLGSNTKPEVKVLQVYPDSGSSLDLTSNLSLPSSNSPNVNSADLVKQITDYKLTITKMKVSEFENYIASGKELNGVYNMIILGFADSFGNADFNNAGTFTKLIDFIKTGQSVMFTHDTLTYRYLNPIDISQASSKKITSTFRDYIGQARYKDENNLTEEDIYKKFDVSTGQYVTQKINHDLLNSSDTGKVSLGLTKGILDQFNGTKYTNNVPSKVTPDPNAGSFQSGTETSSVHKINNGLINQYPFTLDDKANLSVAPTHYQWYQLNLEDADVVPWYTLNTNGAGYNPYDARNYYYTYSKGNITYSGTGHSASGYTVDEYKLFLNTMVKAERGANHNPTINVTNLDDGTIISRNQDKLSFSFTPRDRDNDPISYMVTVKNGNTVLCQRSANNVKQGQEVFIDFNKSEYISTGVNNLTVVIDAWDPQNAKAPTETRSVNITNGPNISLGYTKDANGYLVGDNATITVAATANKATQDINTTFSNIVYNITSGDSDAVVVNKGANGLSFNDIHFTPNPDNSPQSKDYNFTLNQTKNGMITFKGQVTYNQTGVTETQTSPLTINIPVLEGHGNITIHDNNNQVVNSSQSTVQVYKDTVKIKDVPLTGSINSSGFSSGTYTFKLTGLPTGYVVDGSDTVTKTFSYDNNIQDIDFKVKLAEVPKVIQISHGLYVNNSIQEGSVNLTQNTNATFGINFTANYKNPVVQVDLDNLIRAVSADSFKCFKVDSSGSLVPVEPNISVSSDGSNLVTISFSDIDTNSSYLIQYSIKIGSNSSYTNKATLNDVSRTVNITCEELKDLF